jgi:predicted  nucleic acid-binding Zn-ribbon protein
MIEKQPRKYEIPLDEELPDSIFSRKPSKKSNEKPTSPPFRWQLIPLVLFLLLGIALVFTYMNMKAQISQILSSGDQKAQTITEDLESKFSSLSLKVATLEDEISKLDKSIAEQKAAVAKQISPLHQNLTTLQTELKSTQAALERQKTENDTKYKEITTIGGNVAVLETSMKEFKNALSTDVKHATEDVKSVRSDLTAISNDIKPLKGMEAQNQKQYAALEAGIKKEETRASQELEKAVTKLHLQIQTLKQEIADLDPQQSKSTTKKTTTPSPPPDTKSQFTAPAKPELPAIKPETPPIAPPRKAPSKSGDLMEQDIDR